MRPRHVFASLLACLLLAVAASAADWRQFRQDGYRSGRSPDRLPGPLTEIWSWEPGIFKGSQPFGSVVVWGNRLYSFSMENKQPYLVCVDARTGTRYWQQPLGSSDALARPDVGPVVTGDGRVFAYGGGHPEIRLYRGLDGLPLDKLILPIGGNPAEADLNLRRIFMFHGPRSTMLIPPGPRAHWRFGRADLSYRGEPRTYFALGPALLTEGGVTSLTRKDLIVRWIPGAAADYTRLAHYSPEYQYLDLTPCPRFEGYPAAQVLGGLVVADDATRRFVGVVSPDQGMIWHWDIPWSVGVPSTEGNRIFMGIGGPGARSGLIALASGTGEQLWTFPSLPPPGDTQGLGTTQERYLMTHVVNGNPIHPYSMLGAQYGVDFPSVYRVGIPMRPGQEPTGRDYKVTPQGAERARSRDRRAGDLPRSPIFSVEGRQDAMVCSTVGHLRNIGLVLAQRRVYGWVANSLVSVDQATGQPVWQREHPHYHPITDLVASRDHLLICQAQGTLPTMAPTLWGVDLETGKLEWSTTLPHAGRVAVAQGLLFVNSGEMVTALAPAERTFRLAIDSTVKEHYSEDPAGTEPRDPEQAEPPACQDPPEERPSPSARQRALIFEERPSQALSGLADATLLRLQFGKPLEELVKEARDRRRISGDVPRVLSLEWTTSDRRERRVSGGPAWDDRTTAAFVATCARLAAEFRPDHFELAPEVNVFLSYNPTQVEQVRSLLRSARAAIRKVAPDTKVLVSYNAEVLNGTYGRARHFPFRDVPTQPDSAVTNHLSLLQEGDEAGLTTYPQSGHIGHEQLLPTYLLKVVARFGDKPLLVTRLGVLADIAGPTGLSNQTRFLKRIIRSLYWLNARIVAYPDLVGEKDDTRVLRAGETERPAMELWKDLLRWKRVKELTASQPARTE